MYEGQMNDSRQNILTLKSKRLKETNSTIANYVKFIEYIYDNNKKIIGAVCEDKITNELFRINCKVSCNCTGVYADLNLGENSKFDKKIIQASRGTHLVVNSHVFDFKNKNVGSIIPKTSDGRLIFVIPYYDKYIIGTTDEMCSKDEKVMHEKYEEEWLKKEVSENYNIDPDFLSKNTTSIFAGLRPLVYLNPNDKTADNSGQSTKHITRKHVIYRDETNNLYTLLGGKWTTYLTMGEDLVDKILENEPELKKKSDQLRTNFNTEINKDKKESIISKKIFNFFNNTKF